MKKVPGTFCAQHPSGRSGKRFLTPFSPFSALWLSLTVSIAAAADDWPQFRGPGGQGHSDATGLPLTWSETENVTWKVAVAGLGWSSPVVLGEQIWMTTAVQAAGSVTLRAICVQSATGRLLHDVEVFHVEKPGPIHEFNSYASPTPVIEPGRLYCDFGAMGTACLDSTTGRILWRRRLPIDHQVGPGSSPILYGNLLVLVRDGRDVQYIAALDKRTGKTVWKTDRPAIEVGNHDFKKAFSTPLVIELAGRRQMIVPGARWVVSYVPATGEPIWRAGYPGGYSNVPRPVFGHGMVYICTGSFTPQLWAIRVDGRGDVTDTHVVWKATRQIPIRSSPLLAGEQIYLVSDGGVATCFDARSGRTLWRERLDGDYSASPVCADGRIHFFSQEGKTTVLRPGKEFVRLAENQLQGRLKASPAIVGKTIFLRTDTHLYRIENRPREYSSGPLWTWNDMLTEDHIRSTLRDLASQKVKQAWVHPRPGLMTPYLEADWFRLWKVALEEAERLDMNIWIYDENSYPSGFAGGLLPEAMPESRGRGLHFREAKRPGKPGEGVVAIFRLADGGCENVTHKARAGRPLPEARYLVAYVRRAGDSPWFGGKCYVDLLMPGVTEKFLEITMEAYRRQLGDQFGKREYTLYRASFQGNNTTGKRYSARLCVPKGKGPFPAMLCLHGHGGLA